MYSKKTDLLYTNYIHIQLHTRIRTRTREAVFFRGMGPRRAPVNLTRRLGHISHARPARRGSCARSFGSDHERTRTFESTEVPSYIISLCRRHCQTYLLLLRVTHKNAVVAQRVLWYGSTKVLYNFVGYLRSTEVWSYYVEL